MLEFLKILFFSKIILLTPNFVDIEKNNKLTLLPKEILRPLNSGAHIEIKLNNNYKNLDYNKLIDKIPKKSIKAIAYYNKKYITTFEFNGGVSYSNKNIFLILRSKNITDDTKINKLEIKSLMDLNNIQVYWYNTGK